MTSTLNSTVRPPMSACWPGRVPDPEPGPAGTPGRLAAALREGAEASAAAIGGALQPMAETTLAGLAHHGEALHARVEQAVQQQLAGLSEGFERSRVATEASWAKVVSEQTQAQQALVSDLRQHLQAFSDGQGTHAEALVARLGERLQADARGNAEAWRAAAEQQQALNSALVERQQQALLASSEHLDARAQALLQALEQHHSTSQALLQGPRTAAFAAVAGRAAPRRARTAGWPGQPRAAAPGALGRDQRRAAAGPRRAAGAAAGTNSACSAGAKPAARFQRPDRAPAGQRRTPGRAAAAGLRHPGGHRTADRRERSRAGQRHAG